MGVTYTMSNTNLELRPHQERALNTLRATWKLYDAHLMQAPTGAGKTAIAAEITAGMEQRGLKVVFVVPYTTLVDQTIKAFVSYGLPEPSVIWRDDPRYDPNNPIQIASADTLIRREFPDCDLVIIDECHIRRKALLELMSTTSCKWVGLTATPFANWLGTYYKNFIKVTTVRELINQGYLSEYDVYAPTKPNLTGVKTTNTAAYGKDYRENDIAEIMGEAKIVGDIVQTWLTKGENQPTIAFCVNVAHAGHVTNGFNRVNVPAEIMTAETPQHERKAIISRFEQGITKVICNVGVLVAGFDSDVRCIIYARPTKSEARWIQCIGRGLRTAPGKDRCIILDHSGTVFRLGLPCSIEYDELPSDDDGLKEQQQAKREKQKEESQPKECPKCHYMKPAGEHQCKKCGHKPLAGEDVETDEDRELGLLKGEKIITKKEKQQFFSELIGYSNEVRLQKGKQYKYNWPNGIFKNKFGHWPDKSYHRTPKSPSMETRNFIKHSRIKYSKWRQKQQQLKQPLTDEQREQLKENVKNLREMLNK
jgi:superfamily II DNA or RNA helicase